MKTKRQTVRTIGWGIGATLLVAEAIYGINAFTERRNRNEELQVKGVYERVLELADKDQNGKLSEIEKTLLFERLNNNRYYGGVRLPEWSNLGAPTAYDLPGLREVQKIYEKEK